MGKLMSILLVAVMTAPAMAAVEISVSDNGGGTFDINYVCDGADADGGYALMAGIAIIVSVDTGDTIDAVIPAIDGESTAADPGYGVFMKTAQIGGDPLDWVTGASPVATPDSPGEVGGLGENQITLEFGALYDADIDAPLAEGTLCTITVTGDSAVTLALEDVARGGIVMEGGAAPSSVVLNPIIIPPPPGCTCRGDVNDDDKISIADMSAIISYLSPDHAGTEPPYTVDPIPEGDECYDVNEDGKISIADMSAIISFLCPYFAPTIPPYTYHGCMDDASLPLY